MILEANFDDKDYILGERNWKTRLDECWGTHHLKVIASSYPALIDKEVAIPVTKPRFWVIYKKKEDYERKLNLTYPG